MRSGYYGQQPKICADGSVSFPGVTFGSRKLTVHHQAEDMLVIKVSGGNCFRGAGYVPSVTYSAAEFIVMQLREEEWHTVVVFPLKKS